MSRFSQPAFPRVGSAAGGAESGDGVDIDRVHQVRTTVAQAGMQRPAGVARSVFDQVPKPPKKPKAPRRHEPLPDLGQITIETGIPVASPVGFRAGNSSAALLLEAMSPGNSVVLTELQSRTMRTNARKLGIPVAVRNIGDGKARVWRLAKPAQPAGAKP